MRPDRTDAKLIAESLTSPNEFGEVFQRHHDSVYAFVARRVGRDNAADVTSEVFVTAFRIRARYETDRASCLPWLYGIAHNTVGDRLRSLKRQERVFLHRVAGADASQVELAEDRVVADSVAHRLNSALGRLSKPDRDALLLFAIEGMTYAEISAVLGVPVGTVGSRLRRARRRVLKQIPDLEQIADHIDRQKEVEDG